MRKEFERVGGIVLPRHHVVSVRAGPKNATDLKVV